MQRSDVSKFIIAVVVSQSAGLLGSLFTFPAIAGWYSTIIKPEFAPPNWVFGPVWTTLFFLMGIAAFLVWRKGFDHPGVKTALGMFALQLILNTSWSLIFFGLHSPGGAFVEIILLWLAIIATMVLFAKVSRRAAWLLAPYLAWVSFAAYLNYAIWMLN